MLQPNFDGERFFLTHKICHVFLDWIKTAVEFLGCEINEGVIVISHLLLTTAKLISQYIHSMNMIKSIQCIKSKCLILLLIVLLLTILIVIHLKDPPSKSNQQFILTFGVVGRKDHLHKGI